MALIRTLSVYFPMSIWINNLTKSKTVVKIIVFVYAFWFVFYTYNLVFYKIVWYPDILRKSCEYYSLHFKIFAFHVLVVTYRDMEFQLKREEWEPVVRFVPTVFYPILTVALILQLRTIKKKQKKVNKNALSDRSNNTTNLIIFMTGSFMLSEGLAGLTGILTQQASKSVAENETEENINWVSALGTFQFICINLRTINASTHPFICFAMSSQYRETVKRMLCLGKKNNGKTIKVSTASAVSLQSITERTSLDMTDYDYQYQYEYEGSPTSSYSYPSYSYEVSKDYNYLEEQTVYDKIYTYSSDVNFLFQAIVILINLVHLLILIQQEIRSNTIYVLMIGICVSDLLNFSISIYLEGVDRGCLNYPQNLCDDEEKKIANRNSTQYVFAIPVHIYDITNAREGWEHWVRIVPTVSYPVLTALLLFKLSEIKERRRHANERNNKKKDKSDNLTKLILFMTISFMLSEGIDGVRSFLIIDAFSSGSEFRNLRKTLFSSQYIITSLRCFNAMSHLFVCYAMSSQYRNTTRRILYLERKQSITMKVIPVTSASSTDPRTSRKRKTKDSVIPA
ncbi:hypothetical protein GCK72_019649 [Caenorhabditis remanei]|uniref:G-protein coupled receptors family 1 profile domain-containing protein n=1 Tax=Caenorhabditis remanei TaxID=31234 RepID=A0A6A5GEK3_CAERE|nr:hypothetical protein GCK72_019649 [Caenorhabditis remanei]KAF1753093.1 hypothetical protein GCK72_019649 [Caenorhabditis remanei]